MNTDYVVAIASVVTATSVLIMLYQSWVSAKNLREFQEVSNYEKEQSRKIEAVKLQLIPLTHDD